MLDSVQPVQMPDRILRHGGIPFVHASEKWFGVNREDLLQFFATIRTISSSEDWRICCRANHLKNSEERAVCRSAMRKLIVDKRRGQQALAFGAWHQEAKSLEATSYALLS